MLKNLSKTCYVISSKLQNAMGLNRIASAECVSDTSNACLQLLPLLNCSHHYIHAALNVNRVITLHSEADGRRYILNRGSENWMC